MVATMSRIRLCMQSMRGPNMSARRFIVFPLGGVSTEFFYPCFPYVLNDVPQVPDGFCMMFLRFLMCSPRVFLIAPHSIP
jgi:hypothetical protein